MASLPDIDWDKFRAGTVVGSKVDNKIYEITEFEFSEQVDFGMPRRVRQNVELELGTESTGTATPAWWIPDPYQSTLGTPYLLLDGHGYMLLDYQYELPTMTLKVGLTRVPSADVLVPLSPFERAVQSFRQSLTSSR